MKALLKHKKKVLLIFLFCFSFQAYPQNTAGRSKTFTISGHIRDDKGEVLIGANIFTRGQLAGTTSNTYGYYSISLKEGKQSLYFSFVSHITDSLSINLTSNIVQNIILKPKLNTLESVQVSSKEYDQELASLRMGMIQINNQDLKKIPSLSGESDLIKAIQLLPGIQATGEGLSNFNVRGGNYDQNLIILDEATIYNPSHLLGFFSIFNSDILKSTQIYKGIFPAKYGGRLSSLLEVNLKDGNKSQFTGYGGIGTIASRLSLEIPVFKGKGSILISGRRSYADIFLPLLKNEEVRDNRIYFFDSYIKANYQLNEKNKFFLSGYLGRDVFKYKNDYYVTWGNISGTFRWNHIFSPKLFSNLSVIASSYSYRLGQTSNLSGVEWNSSLADLKIKYDFTLYLNPKNTITFGLSSSYQHFNPGYTISASDSSIFNDFAVPSNNILEHSVYIGNDQTISSNLSVSYGLRASLFQNIGEATVYNFDENFNKIDSSYYAKGEIYNQYAGFEPRVSLNYVLPGHAVIKAGYSHMVQFLHLISNTTTGTPLDIWLPSGPNIKPQFADQFALGYQKYVLGKAIKFSIEGYYKRLGNQLDYKDHADIILNPELEGELRFGKAEAYGLEFLIQKKTGNWQGLISYTLSKVTKVFPDINNGQAFPANNDRRHDLSLLLSYDTGNKWEFSALWIFLSGSPTTLPVGKYEFGNVILPMYSERNAYRLPPYHRLDLSATRKGKVRPGKKFYGEWNFAIYNAYNRKNTWIVYFKSDENNPLVTEAYKLYLFSIVPSISYNFKF
ncbi:MAG: TonB-dependent receptor [Bacteroidales bacterium]|nr:TonB-dependent receptor [Bacteroidales bacterium]